MTSPTQEEVRTLLESARQHLKLAEEAYGSSLPPGEVLINELIAALESLSSEQGVWVPVETLEHVMEVHMGWCNNCGGVPAVCIASKRGCCLNELRKYASPKRQDAP